MALGALPVTLRRERERVRERGRNIRVSHGVRKCLKLAVNDELYSRYGLRMYRGEIMTADC